MRYPPDRPVASLFPPALFPKVLIGQPQEHPLVYVAVQGGGADGGGETGLPGRQCRPGGVSPPPGPYRFMFV